MWRRQQRGGRESEDYALRKCVELHQQHLDGKRPSMRARSWVGGGLDEAYARAGEVTAE